jgi:very-short-patch-repair endonuclease
VVEVDSFEFHRTLAAFEADRRRDTDLQRAGFRVLRVTEQRINEDPGGVGEDIKALLSIVPIGRGRAAC